MENGLSAPKGAYKYAGIPMSPAIAKPLILNLLEDGNLIERKIIISETIRLHLSYGGIKSKTNLTSTLKKALSDLKKDKLIESPRTGFWRINKNISCMSSIDLENSVIQINKNLGVQYTEQQTSYVYVYYFPSYKELALLKKSAIWQCKIGRTECIPDVRINSQITTSHSESPCIEIMHKTENSRELEIIIHNILSMRNRKVSDGGGREWFWTNPDEIKKIIEIIENIII